MKFSTLIRWLACSLACFLVAMSLHSCVGHVLAGEPDAATRVRIGFGLTKKAEKKAEPKKAICECLSGGECKCGSDCQCDKIEYKKVRARAWEQFRPLVVWVGKIKPDYAACGPEALHVRVHDFQGDAGPGVIVAIPRKDDLYITLHCHCEEPCLEEIRAALEADNGLETRRSISAPSAWREAPQGRRGSGGSGVRGSGVYPFTRPVAGAPGVAGSPAPVISSYPVITYQIIPGGSWGIGGAGGVRSHGIPMNAGGMGGFGFGGGGSSLGGSGGGGC